MKYVKNEKPHGLSKQIKLVIILASILVFLVAAAVASKLIVDYLNEEKPSDFEPPVLLEGEAYANGYYTVAYPKIEAENMTYVEITTPDGKYGLMRDDDGALYVLYTPTGEDELSVYYPPLADKSTAFDYNSLFTVADSYGITNVYYLCSVLGTLYFDQRIDIPTDAVERDEFLRYYGFSEDNIKRIEFTYTDEDGEPSVHLLEVGDKLMTGVGYYYRVDNRPYIYVTSNTYLGYAFGGAASLINSMLVSEGLKTDSYLEPYLTPEYKQWKTTLHDKAGDVVEAGTNVLVSAQILSPQNPLPTDDPESFISGGYVGAGYGKTEFDLSKYTDAKYASMIQALVGAAVGSYDGNELVFTIIGSSLAANIPDGADEATYTYTVSAIEAILDGGDVFAPGTPVGNNKLLKVTYTAAIGSESVTPAPYHAVINLESALIPQSAKDAFAASAVGELASPIEFSVTYSKNDTQNQTISQLIITEIHDIYKYNSTTRLDTVEANSIVTYSYVVKIGSQTSETYQGYLDLSKDDSPKIARDRELLIGKSEGVLSTEIVVETYVEYPQVVADFDTVSVNEISGFVKSEIMVSFRFVNEDARDPFYGESVYENTINNSDRNYAMNDSICQTVLAILGGIGENATASTGYKGSETVAIGLNTETMIEFGLYAPTAYKIRFVLPRGIEDTGEDEDTLHYDWVTTLAFTLYISEENEDGTRYVASDLYDIVVKAPVEDFVFLNYEFIEFWARRSPLLLDVENITSLKLELNMPEVYGSYTFDMTYSDYYYDSNGNRYKDYADGRIHDIFMEIAVTQGEGSMETALSRYIEQNNLTGAVDFSKFYGNGVDNWIEFDTEDVAYFRDVMFTIYLTNYVGLLSEEDQLAAMAYDPIMTLELNIKGTSDKYVYEFRRFEDRRVMVTIKCCDLSGNVRYESSSFYISSSVTREIVTAFVYLLNGRVVDSDIFYEDLVPIE